MKKLVVERTATNSTAAIHVLKEQAEKKFFSKCSNRFDSSTARRWPDELTERALQPLAASGVEDSN